MRDTCGLTQRSYKPHRETRDAVCVKYCIHVFMTIPWRNVSKCMVSHVREGQAGKGDAKGKSREEEMHEWVRKGRCRIWKGVALRSGWDGTEHDEGRGGAMRAVRTERGTGEG